MRLIHFCWVAMVCFVVLRHIYLDAASISNLVSKINADVSEVLRHQQDHHKHRYKESCLDTSTKPAIFIHVGPPKTGTTSVQDFFACRSVRLQEQHNTFYYGKVNNKSLKTQCPKNIPNDFVRPVVQYHRQPAAIRLQQEVERRLFSNQSVIMSDEDFGRVTDQVQTMLAGINRTLAFHVAPVIAYRRYNEWLVSLYHYAHKPQWYQPDWAKWNLNDATHRIPTFRSFWHTHQNITHPSISLAEQFESLLKETLATHNYTIVCPQILNIHKGSLIQEFVSLLPSAANHSANVVDAVHANKDTNLPFAVDSERLASKLKREGSIHERWGRRMVVEKLRAHMQTLYTNITIVMNPKFVDCLTLEEEQALLNKSLQAASAMLPPASLEEEHAAIQQSFEKARSDGVFCNVQLDELVKEEGWKPFLECLQKEEPC